MDKNKKRTAVNSEIKQCKFKIKSIFKLIGVEMIVFFIALVLIKMIPAAIGFRFPRRVAYIILSTLLVGSILVAAWYSISIAIPEGKKLIELRKKIPASKNK